MVLVNFKTAAFFSLFLAVILYRSQSCRSEHKTKIPIKEKEMGSSVKRILCYGDSLTAGFCLRGAKFVPYANFLKNKLSSNGLNVEIDHYGFSGWTTQQLLSNSDKDVLKDFTGHKGPGLKKALENEKYDLLILMAGTNDLGHGKTAEDIFKNIETLAEFSLAANVSVLHVGIPDSAFLYRSSEARVKRDDVNKQMKNFAKSSKEQMITYTPCPFDFSPNSPNFDTDGLHFSEIGYQALGEGLSGVVSNLLGMKM